VNVDSLLFERGWLLYEQRPDKEWGLVDCISFILMQKRGVLHAVTNDHHFEQAGFIILL
jgi:predicted nucleic acid-binding protein